MRTKKFVYHLLAMFVIAATLLSACGTKTEGELTVIALPHDWCNYGEVIAGFSAKYGIKVNEGSPVNNGKSRKDVLPSE